MVNIIPPSVHCNGQKLHCPHMYIIPLYPGLTRMKVLITEVVISYPQVLDVLLYNVTDI